MALRLVAALLVLLGAILFAAGGDRPSRMDLAELRAERQRLVQLPAPDPVEPPASSRSDAPEPEPADAGEPAQPVDVDEPAETASDSQAEQSAQTGENASDQTGAQEPEAIAEVAEPAPELAPEIVAPEPTLLVVTGNRVNLRAGPGTDNSVVGSVVRDQVVTLVQRTDNGWAEIIVDGMDGTVFMSGDFLSETQ